MTRKLAVTALLVAAVAVTGACQAKKEEEKKAPAGPAGKTEEEKTVYAIGTMMGRQISGFGLSPSELEALKQGVADSASGKKPEVELETYGPKIQAFAQARTAKAAEAEKAKAAGLPRQRGQGAGGRKIRERPRLQDHHPGHGQESRCYRHWSRSTTTGTLTSGDGLRQLGDSGASRSSFALNGVIPCWTEGVQKMKVGGEGHASSVRPSIAYGDQGRPPQIPGGATLVFEVELLGIKGK